MTETTDLNDMKAILQVPLGNQIGRVHRLWRSAITAAVQSLDMTEARWTAMLHLKMLGEGATQQALAQERIALDALGAGTQAEGSARLDAFVKALATLPRDTHAVDAGDTRTRPAWQRVLAPLVDVRPTRDQPFYHLLAENEETEYVAYVSEQKALERFPRLPSPARSPPPYPSPWRRRR